MEEVQQSNKSKLRVNKGWEVMKLYGGKGTRSKGKGGEGWRRVEKGVEGCRRVEKGGEGRWRRPAGWRSVEKGGNRWRLETG